MKRGREKYSKAYKLDERQSQAQLALHENSRGNFSPEENREREFVFI
jgi:hypothetical protein